MTKLPLEGIRVLELGELLAGPFVGTLLGEFGAEVIKVERPGGDVLRKFGPIVNGESMFWAVNARNKKSLVLDLGLPDGLAVLRDLMAECDVVINSLRPGTLEKWGLSEEVIKCKFPGTIVVYASAFGRSGPYSNKGGYDPVAQGFSGLSYLTGEQDGPPMRAGGSIPVCDFMTGVAGALGAVLALFARQRADGGGADGQSVDIALYDVAFRMTAPLLSYLDLAGETLNRNGNHSLGGAPTGHFPTQDGSWVCVSVQNNAQFRSLCGVIGREDWLTDARFQNLDNRTKHRDQICEGFSRWAAGQTREDLIRTFDDAGLVAGTINSIDEMASDPHLAERGYHWSDDPVLGQYRAPDVIPRLSETPGDIRCAAPALGADTLEILQSVLKYSVEQCQALRAAGVHGDVSCQSAKTGTF
ncbi:formyl-CoA transferase [Roseovarius lutimaris]|uniref:Formyl-CoA transferase n=1 Tax=Roseovarius lutimaris TaxID=1005928 RepID=A0A1I5GS94_9RHOB|nr:CoA transferase [Roseovarius lutimaris]SFO38924.1 formyl-CoA transferase [Roseovarius lutimaris]